MRDGPAVEAPTTSAVPERASASRRSRRTRLGSIEAAAIAGIICAIGWSISLRGLLAAPGVDAPADEVARYYGDPGAGSDAVVFLQLQVLATIAFLWFIGVVRNRLGPHAPRLAGTVFFGAGILIAGLLFVGSAALAAPAVLVEAGGKVPAPGEASMMRALAAVVLSVFTPRIATLIMFATATLARRTGALPGWLVMLTYAVGAFEFLNVTISEPALYVFPAWVALVSVVLLRRKATGDLDLGAPPARRAA